MIQTRNVRTTPFRTMFNQAIQDERAWNEDQRKMEANYPRFGIGTPGEGGRIEGIVKWIERRVNERNQSVTAITTGMPGGGKSWSCMNILERLDEGFGIENISFYPKEFIHSLKEGKKSFLIDDAGMQLAARDSMTKTNKEYTKLFQGLRFKNKIVMLTVPSFSMVDKNLRHISQIYMQAIGINRLTNRVKMVIRFLSIDPKRDQIYYYSPIVKNIVNSQGRAYAVYERCLTIDVPKPSKALIAQYEDKKSEAFGSFVDSIDSKEVKKNGDKSPSNGQQKYLIVGKMLGKGLSIEDICEVLNSNKNSVKRLASYYKKRTA